MYYKNYKFFIFIFTIFFSCNKTFNSNRNVTKNAFDALYKFKSSIIVYIDGNEVEIEGHQYSIDKNILYFKTGNNAYDSINLKNYSADFIQNEQNNKNKIVLERKCDYETLTNGYLRKNKLTYRNIINIIYKYVINNTNNNKKNNFQLLTKGYLRNNEFQYPELEKIIHNYLIEFYVMYDLSKINRYSAKLNIIRKCLFWSNLSANCPKLNAKFAFIVEMYYKSKYFFRNFTIEKLKKETVNYQESDGQESIFSGIMSSRSRMAHTNYLHHFRPDVIEMNQYFFANKKMKILNNSIDPLEINNITMCLLN